MDNQEGVDDNQTVLTETNQEATETSSNVNVAFSTDDIDSEYGRTADFESKEAHIDVSNLSLDQSKKSEEEDSNITEEDLDHIDPIILEFDEASSDIEKNECDDASIEINMTEQNGTVGFIIPQKNRNVTTARNNDTSNGDKETLSTQVCTF